MSADNLTVAHNIPGSSASIRGSSRMAVLIRAFDWSATALGPIESWPESLLTSVNMMLACAFPSLIFWGPEMTQLYNDAFIPLFAERHSSGLGQTARQCWHEAWHIISPRLDRVFRQGETVYEENALVPILRDGRVQDVFWTYSYSPIFSAQGDVLGILVLCQDTTRESAALADLRTSEARSQRVLQSIGDAVIVTDEETRVIGMNAVAERLTGFTEQQAAGTPLTQIFRIVNEATRLPVPSPADKVRTLGTVVGLANHTILIARDGAERPIDDSGAPIFDEDGKLSGIVLVFRDISERRAAERERERLTEQLSRVLAVTTDAIVALDRNWNFSYLNPRALALYAGGRQLLGRPIWDEFPEAYYEGSPFVEHYNRAMNEGIPSSLEAYYPEPLNRWLHIDVYPTSDGLITFSRDVTAEHEAREALRLKSEEAERQRSEIETVYRTAPIGLALFDTEDFRYLRLNDRQAEFFGLEPEQIVGRTLTEMAPIDGLDNLFKQVLAGKPVVNFPLEGSVVTRPGEHRYWTVSYSPVTAPDGSVQAITAASLEVTQQKRTEAALLQSEKLAVAGRLAASIAHEINNPLEAVTNLLYLAGTTTDLVDIKTFIETAERELQRVSAITNQTLRFYRQSTNPQLIHCDALINSVIPIFQNRLTNGNIQVEKRYRAPHPVRCFEGEIRQVLSNLLGNAIDAMASRRGRLLLRARESANWHTGQRGAVVTVADNGVGIPATALSRIFEPFYTTKEVSGTGLGLWVSREIVERHGGKLSVRSSQRPGRTGAVFTIFLPFEAVTR
jgi:PAS domain S-box-containing protein